MARCGMLSFSARLRGEAFFAQGLGGFLRFHDEKFVAGVRQSGKAEHFHRRGRTGRLDRLAAIVDERLHFAAIIAADERLADFERAHLHDDGRGRAAAGFDLRFDHGAARGRGGRSLQLHHFRLHDHLLEQMVDARSLGRGDRHDDGFAAPIFRGQFVLLQLLFHPVDVAPGKSILLIATMIFTCGAALA